MKSKSSNPFSVDYDDFECPTPEDDAVSAQSALGAAAALLLIATILLQHHRRRGNSRMVPKNRESLIWACLLFSVNLTILGIFQYNTMDTLSMMGVVALLVCGARLGTAACGKAAWLEPMLQAISGIDDLPDHPTEVTARDKYRDFTTDMVTTSFLGKGRAWLFAKRAFLNIPTPLTHTLCCLFVPHTTTGAGQLILISCYVFAAYEAGRPCFEDTRIYAFYILGILSQIGYTLTKTYFARFYRTYHYWRVVLERATPLGYSYKSSAAQHIGRLELWIRFLLSVLVNEIGLIAVFVLLPIQLASSRDPFDFVLNSVAAYFIVELDDTDEKEFLLGDEEEEVPPDAENARGLTKDHATSRPRGSEESASTKRYGSV
jgi:hypothetical protein